MSIETFVDLRDWFRERLDAVMERESVGATHGARLYLIELLARAGVKPSAGNGRPLAMQLAEARECVGPEQLARYRAMGDDALYLAGFFAEHLEARGLSPTYVATMGGTAYEAASVLATRSATEAVRSDVYRELATQFEPFSRVLDEVRESTALRTPQDIVRLYDKWRRTGSPRIAERLTREGVYPTVSGDKGPTFH